MNLVPTLNYRIWFSPRTGSTFLCEALSHTQVAGNPGEFFNLDNELLKDHFSAVDYNDLKQKIYARGLSSNGVFGIKHSYTRFLYDIQMEEWKSLTGLGDEDKIWSDIFPNCKHIFLTRRDKVKQAVSWWKAIQDSQWHLREGESRSQKASFYADKYNVDALTHLFREAALRECFFEQKFTELGIQPLTIVYEDFIRDYEGTLNEILDFLEVDRRGMKLEVPNIKATANDINIAWTERFRQDLQVGWDKPAY